MSYYNYKPHNFHLEYPSDALDHVQHEHLLDTQWSEDIGVIPCNALSLVILIIIEVVVAMQFTYLFSQMFPKCLNKFYEKYPCKKTRLIMAIEVFIELILSVILIYLITGMVQELSESLGENSLRCADTVVTIVPYLVIFFNKPLLYKLDKVFPLYKNN
jgi:hypothetical protein